MDHTLGTAAHHRAHQVSHLAVREGTASIIQRQGVAMDELGKLKARRQRQTHAVVRLEREVTALRNRGGPRASLEALEAVLSRHTETLRQICAGIDAAEPNPAPCTHSGAVRVELSTGELAAWLCPDCDQQFPPEWSQPQEEELQLPGQLLGDAGGAAGQEPGPVSPGPAGRGSAALQAQGRNPDDV
jgi:transposase InsO family protein